MDEIHATHRLGAFIEGQESVMHHAFFPIEAISSVWMMLCYVGTLFAVFTVWLFAPR